MKDILLQFERDEEMQEILEGLTEEQRDSLLIEMREIIKNFSNALVSIQSNLDDEKSVIEFVDNLGKAISMSDLGENVGTEVIEWPEKL
jgi:hypothetical protein